MAKNIYSVFSEDVHCIKSLQEDMVYYRKKLDQTKIFERQVRKNILFKLDRVESALNNHKLNLIRKSKHLTYEELAQIINNTKNIKLISYAKDNGEMIIILNEKNDIIGTAIAGDFDKDIADMQYLKDTRFTHLVLNVLSPYIVEKAVNIKKHQLIQALFDYNNDELIENFFKSYVEYLTPKIWNTGH